MRDGKKAQGGRIFIYLVTAVIAGLILIFGYKVLIGLSGSSDKVTLLNFRTDFERDLDLASPWGTVQRHRYNVPTTYKEVCLINVYADPAEDPVFAQTYPLIHDSWQERAKENVFLLPGGEPFMVANMTFGDCMQRGGTADYLCIPLENGWFEVRFRGWGSSTCVEKI